MARTSEYGHYCSAARALEIIGEKWSLLVVRDLLYGPQRFTDLLRSLGGITPKWLTQRLRDLEAAGVVERDQEAGRREVWYRLSPKGFALKPAIVALSAWGVEYARPPEPGETINPRSAVSVTAIHFNNHGVHLTGPATWVIDFGDKPRSLQFDGERWSYADHELPATLRIETTPFTWAMSLRTADPAERRRLIDTMRLTGDPAAIAELRALVGARSESVPA